MMVMMVGLIHLIRKKLNRTFLPGNSCDFIPELNSLKHISATSGLELLER